MNQPDNSSRDPSRSILAFIGSMALAVLGAVWVIRRRVIGHPSAAPTASILEDLPAPPAEIPAASAPEMTSRRRVATLWAWAACGLLVLSAINMQFTGLRIPPMLATIPALLGGAAIGVASLRWHPAFPALTWRRMTRIRLQLSPLILATGIAALLLLAEINTSLLHLDFLDGASAHEQMFLLAVGSFLVVRGMLPLDLRRAGAVRHGVLSASRRRDLFWLTLITLLALAIRTWNLENAIHLFMDEMNFVEGITPLRDSGLFNPLILRWINGTAQFSYVFPYMQLGGVSIFGPTLVGIRVVSALLGTMTIPALYLLGRTLFDRRVALLAAFLLACFPPHIHFSRLGMNNIADPLLGTLALAFLARGLKTGRPINYVLAGAMLGLTTYFYEGGRVVFPALLGLWLMVIVIFWRARAHWSGMLALVITALLIAAPYYYAQLGTQQTLLPRLASRGHDINYIELLLNLSAEDGGLHAYLRNNLIPPFLHLFYSPDGAFGGGGFFYGGDTPLIMPYFVPVFFLGVFHLLWRPRVAGAVLLLWVLLTGLGNSLIVQPDWTARFVVVFPALALIMALGIVRTWPYLFPAEAWQPTETRLMTTRRLLPTVTLLVIIGLAFIQLPYYFGPHLDRQARQVRMGGHDFHDVMFRARAFPPRTQVIILSDDPFWPPQVSGMMAFWKLDITVQQWPLDETLPSLLASVDRAFPAAFFVIPQAVDTAVLLRRDFPDLHGPSKSPYNVPPESQYWLYSTFANDEPPPG